MRTGSLWVVAVVLGGPTGCFFDENEYYEAIHVTVSAETQRDLADQFPLVLRTEVWNVEPTDDPRVDSEWLEWDQRSILCNPSRFDVTAHHEWPGGGNCPDPDRIKVFLEHDAGIDPATCTRIETEEEYAPEPLDRPVALVFDHPIECWWDHGYSGYDFVVAPL